MILTTKESQPVGFDLNNLSVFERIERFGRAKQSNVEMCEYIGEQLDRDEHRWGLTNPMTEKLFKRMSTCASWLTFRHYIEHDANRLTSANFCGKHLLCQACAIRRGAQKLNAYVSRVEHVLSLDKNLSPWLITFTVKNGSDLLERFTHLQDAFQRLQHRRKNNRPTELLKVAGAVFSYEVPKSKDGEDWHPHIHMMALCTDKPDVGFVDPKTGEGWGLRKEWFDITGDSFQVDVRRKEGQPIIDMACEVMKYAVKFTSQDPEDTWTAFQVLNGRRLFGAFGNLWGVKLPESMLDAPLTGPFIEYVFRYFGGSHYVPVSRVDYSDNYEDASKDEGEQQSLARHERSAAAQPKDADSVLLSIEETLLPAHWPMASVRSESNIIQSRSSP